MRDLLLISAGILILVGVYSLVWAKRQIDTVVVSNFEECVKAGNPIFESYPRQCPHEGEIFIEELKNVPFDPWNETTPIKHKDASTCVITGCSSQLCAEEDIVTTCEWLSEYSCYHDYGVCARQAQGECSWTPNAKLKTCLTTKGIVAREGNVKSDLIRFWTTFWEHPVTAIKE